MIDLIRGIGTAIAHFLYGLYAWAVFVVAILICLVIAIFIPGLDRRRRLLTLSARGFFAFVGIRATVRGLKNLPDDHCIVVANHASYLDGLILQAFLPPRFAYVIKGEMRDIPVVHFLLRRAGSKFVERFIAAGSTRDARTLVKAATAGESLAFFPEGTFIDAPGLGRFRAGAFAAAIKGTLPVVPVVIRGSRKILPADTYLPVPGNLGVDILEAIDSSNAAYAQGSELAELSRRRILEVLDEPDLLVNNRRPASRQDLAS